MKKIILLSILLIIPCVAFLIQKGINYHKVDKNVTTSQIEPIKVVLEPVVEPILVNKMARITCYTDKGIMANGQYTYHGAVAFSDRTVPLNQNIYVSGFGEMYIADRTAKWVDEKYDVPTIDVWMPKEECDKFGMKYDTYVILN